MLIVLIVVIFALLALLALVAWIIWAWRTQEQPPPPNKRDSGKNVAQSGPVNSLTFTPNNDKAGLEVRLKESQADDSGANFQKVRRHALASVP